MESEDIPFTYPVPENYEAAYAKFRAERPGYWIELLGTQVNEWYCTIGRIAEPNEPAVYEDYAEYAKSYVCSTLPEAIIRAIELLDRAHPRAV